MKMHNVSFFARQNTLIAPFKNTAGVFWDSWLAALFQTFHTPDSKKNLLKFLGHLAKHMSFGNNWRDRKWN